MSHRINYAYREDGQVVVGYSRYGAEAVVSDLVLGHEKSIPAADSGYVRLPASVVGAHDWRHSVQTARMSDVTQSDLESDYGPFRLYGQPWCSKERLLASWENDVWCEAARLEDGDRGVRIVYSDLMPACYPYPQIIHRIVERNWPSWTNQFAYNGLRDLMDYMGVSADHLLRNPRHVQAEDIWNGTAAEDEYTVWVSFEAFDGRFLHFSVPHRFLEEWSTLEWLLSHGREGLEGFKRTWSASGVPPPSRTVAGLAVTTEMQLLIWPRSPKLTATVAKVMPDAERTWGHAFTGYFEQLALTRATCVRPEIEWEAVTIDLAQSINCSAWGDEVIVDDQELATLIAERRTSVKRVPPDFEHSPLAATTNAGRLIQQVEHLKRAYEAALSAPT